MPQNILGKIGNHKRWTIGAIECYERNCICSGCSIHKFFAGSGWRCQMKATVFELINRNIPIPDYLNTNLKTKKKCCKCGELKPIEAFNKCSKMKGGFYYYCKSCVSEINKKYRERGI